LTFIAVTRQENDLIPKGHVVAYKQFQLNEGMPVDETVFKWLKGSSQLPKFKENKKTIKITASEIVYTLDKMTGEIQSIKVNGKNMIESGPLPNFWRPLIVWCFGRIMLRIWNKWKFPGHPIV
jgi:hypothetical protein